MKSLPGHTGFMLTSSNAMIPAFYQKASRRKKHLLRLDEASVSVGRNTVIKLYCLRSLLSARDKLRYDVYAVIDATMPKTACRL